MESKKILVVSDTHRRITEVIAFQEKDPHDMLFHLGDLVKDAKTLEKVLHIPVLCVRGNNDFAEYETPAQIVVPVYGKRFLLTHGHMERVGAGSAGVLALAKEEGANVALFGHTHRRFDRVIDGVHILNPGAVSSPRDGVRSLLSLTVFESGNLDFCFIDA